MSNQKKNKAGGVLPTAPLPNLSQTQANAAKKYITETETETDSAFSDSAFESVRLKGD